MDEKLVSMSVVNKIGKKHIALSKHLFCNEDGTPIVFHVLPSPDHDVIVQLIKAGGGTVIDEDEIRSTEAITISSGSQNMENIKEVISSSYIYVCCFHGELIDMEGYRFIPGCDGSNACEGKKRSPSSANYYKTRLSKEEIHQLLMYIIKCETLWKEISENKVLPPCCAFQQQHFSKTAVDFRLKPKVIVSSSHLKVCGNKPWKTVQKSFAFWALEVFYKIASLNTETCGTLLQDDKHQPKSDCTKANPVQTSIVDMDTESSKMVENEKMEVIQYDLEKENSSVTCGKKKLSGCFLQSKNALCEGSRNESEEEEDIAAFGMRKRVADHTSVVIDEGSTSESEEQETGFKGIGKQGFLHNMNNTGEKEVVDELKAEEKSREKKLNEKNKDPNEKDCQAASQVKITPSNLSRVREVMRRNYSVPCNEWLGKNDSYIKGGKMEEMTSSTPIRESVCIQSNMSVSTGQLEKRQINRLYSYKEDMQLLRWICCKRKRPMDPLSGNRIWRFMESIKVLHGRSWQSMRERFRRHIAPNLKDYPIPKEDLQKLTLEIG